MIFSGSKKTSALDQEPTLAATEANVLFWEVLGHSAWRGWNQRRNFRFLPISVIREATIYSEIGHWRRENYWCSSPAGLLGLYPLGLSSLARSQRAASAAASYVD